MTSEVHWSEALAQLLIDNQVQRFCCVADSSVSKLIAEIRIRSDVKIIQTCREDEGIGILSGAYLAGDRGVMMMQSSGFGMCGNALGFNMAAKIPIVLVICKRGDDNESNAVQIPMGRAVEPFLKALKIPFCNTKEVEALWKEGKQLIDHSFNERIPVAFVMPRAR